MRKLNLALALIAISLGINSCGGSGTTTPSPFIGEFAGTWSVSGGDSGTADLTIASSGHLTGTVFNSTTSTTGAVTGHIDKDGSITTTTHVAGHPDFTATGTWALSNGNQTLSGTLTTTGSNPQTGTYTLTRQ